MIARTTFMPEVDIEMDDREYASLLRQGLIVLPPAEPAEVNTPAPTATDTPEASGQDPERQERRNRK